MRKQRFSLKALLTLFLSLSLISCGGGGGGDGDFVGAGTVSISVSPSIIDVGDRMRIRVDMGDINDDGVILKLRFPDGLRYVPNTGSFEVDGNEDDIEPDINQESENDIYLVLFLDADDFGEGRNGVVFVQLEGIEQTSTGKVEVDLDVNDAEIPDNGEFDIEEPEFQAEDQRDIKVES